MKKVLLTVAFLTGSAIAVAAITPGRGGGGGGGGAPSGPAGGVLSGTYPNPSLAADRVRVAGDTMTGQLVAPSLSTVTGAGTGFIQAVTQSAAPSAPTSGFRLYADATNRLAWRGQNGFVRTFDGLANTADRTYTLPDESGTVALTNSASAGYVRLSGDTMTGVLQGTTIRVNAGLVSAPSISFTNDSDTGFWRPSDNQINLAVGGTTVLNVTTSQMNIAPTGVTRVVFDNNGISLTSNASASNPQYRGHSPGMGMYSALNNQLGFSTSSTARLTISSAGEINLPSPSTLLVGTTSNPNSWPQRNSGSINAGYTGIGIANTSNGASASIGMRFENDADVNGIIVRNSSANTGYAGAGSLNVGTVGTTALGFITNNLLRAQFTSAGEFRLSGSSSGYVGLSSPSAPTSYTLTLPSAAPTTNGQILVSTTAGVMSWQSPTYAARITNSGSCAISSQSTNTWVSSVSRPGTGLCTLTITSGIFSDVPWCSCLPEGGDVNRTCQLDTVNTATSTSLTFRTRNPSTGNQDADFNVLCIRN